MDPPAGTGWKLLLDKLSWTMGWRRMMVVLRQTDEGTGGRWNSEVGRLGSCRMLEIWSDISLCSYIMSAYQTEVLWLTGLSLSVSAACLLCIQSRLRSLKALLENDHLCLLIFMTIASADNSSIRGGGVGCEEATMDACRQRLTDGEWSISIILFL